MPELTGYRADSTDQAELEKLVEVLSDSERLLDETIGAALAETDVDRAISDVLERLGTQVGARRVILCEMIGRNRVTCTYEWSAHGVEPLAGSFANFNVKPFNDAWRDSFNEWGLRRPRQARGLTCAVPSTSWPCPCVPRAVAWGTAWSSTRRKTCRQITWG